MRFKRYITELFKSDINVEVKRKSNTFFKSEFIVGDIKYDFQASHWEDEGWHITFTADEKRVNRRWVMTKTDRESISGTGNAAQVFSAIIKLFKIFMKTYKPERFYFYGKEPSRQKLYDRFAKMIVRQARNYKYMKYRDPEWPDWGMKYDFVKEE